MTDTPAPEPKRTLLARVIFMLLMALAFHVCGTVLAIVVIIQFVMVLVSDTPNARLVSFGRNLGSYLRQIVIYLTFATEEVPFPFSDWPAGE
jgi:hypothetical protein